MYNKEFLKITFQQEENMTALLPWKEYMPGLFSW